MAYKEMFINFWYYSGKEKWKIIVYLLFHGLSMIGELGQPFAFAMLINVIQRNDDRLFEEIVFWLIVYGLCFFWFEIFHRSARFIERYVAFRTRKRFVLSMYKHLHGLPLAWHEDNHSGSVISRINKAADALLDFGQSQFMYVQVLMTIIGPIIVLWNLSNVIAIAATMVGIIIMFVTNRLYQLSVPEYRKENEAYHSLAAALHDYTCNMTTIVMLRLGGQVREDIRQRIDQIFPHMSKENKITHVKCFISGLMMLILEIGVIFYYVYEQNTRNEVILLGSVAVIFDFTKRYMNAFLFYTGNYEDIIHWQADFDAVKPILNEPKVSVDLIEDVNAGSASQWHQMEVSVPEFLYPNSLAGIQNIKIQLEQGKKIAFVGESGSGKSTLLKLLRGIVPVKGASVQVGSNEYPVNYLSELTSLIPQEPEIFENTIEYNITMGIGNIEGNDSITEAAEIARINERIEAMPKGYNSDIREKGVNMSGGEKQRLALARGLYSIGDSSLILLDEPTSSVDPIIEKSIYNRIFQKYGKRCIVSIVHRLHLTKEFDYIYVFDKGNIVEEGRFDTLIEKNGHFSRLWNVYINK